MLLSTKSKAISELLRVEKMTGICPEELFMEEAQMIEDANMELIDGQEYYSVDMISFAIENKADEMIEYLRSENCNLIGEYDCV